MKKNKPEENYIERVPCRKEDIAWSKSEDGKITLEIENKGVFNRVFQLLFKKPKISYIHLDDMGSFVWPLIDGKSDIFEIGKKVYEHFGENAEPLYPRLSKYFETLESCKFITFKK